MPSLRKADVRQVVREEVIPLAGKVADLTTTVEGMGRKIDKLTGMVDRFTKERGDRER